MKAIGMFFIILGHTCPSGWEAFIYAFSVPLFFMMSGLLNKHEDCVKHCIGKCIRTLFIPYLFITAICTFIEFVLHPFGLNVLVIKIAYIAAGIQAFAGIAGCGTMWFVYTLILLKLLHQIIGNNIGLHRVVSIAFLCMSAILHHTIGKGFGCAITDVLLAYPCFYLGYELKSFLLNDIKLSKLKMVVGGGGGVIC